MKQNDEFTNIAQSIVPGEQDMAAMDALARRWAGHPEERASYFAAHPEARRRGKWVMVLLAVALLLGLLAWAKVLVDTVGQRPGDAGAWFEGIFGGLMAMALVVVRVSAVPFGQMGFRAGKARERGATKLIAGRACLASISASKISEIL